MSGAGLGVGDTEVPIHSPRTEKGADRHNILRYVPREKNAQWVPWGTHRHVQPIREWPEVWGRAFQKQKPMSGQPIREWVSSDVTRGQEEEQTMMLLFSVGTGSSMTWGGHCTEERERSGLHQKVGLIGLPFLHPSWLIKQKVLSFFHPGHLSILPSHFHLHGVIHHYCPLSVSMGSVSVVGCGPVDREI